MKTRYFFTGLFLISLYSAAQRDFPHLANQTYLELPVRKQLDCSNIPDSLFSNLTLRICANLRLQRLDSIQHLYLDSLRNEIGQSYGDTVLARFDSLQVKWEDFRDLQAELVYKSYEGCGGCHSRAIDTMETLSLFTEMRIANFRQLLKFYRRRW